LNLLIFTIPLHLYYHHHHQQQQQHLLLLLLVSLACLVGDVDATVLKNTSLAHLYLYIYILLVFLIILPSFPILSYNFLSLSL
jgi:hypothetical protein